jgi:hypothetical protein
MRWKTYERPNKPGDYILALKNTARNASFFAHIEITENGDWIRGGSDGEGVFYGGHIQIEAYAKITSPFKP